MSNKLRLVSMFSGCGGMDLGFLGGFEFLGKTFASRPFELVWANDVNSFACATYRHNLKHEIHIGDVNAHLATIPNCDVLVGGFPCQDISVNGKRAGTAGARSGLYRAMVDAVRKVRPKLFIAENVKGLLYKYNEESLRQVINDFSDLGYNVEYKLLNSADFGVPQNRERVIIVGMDRNYEIPFCFPDAFLSKKNRISSKQAIGDLEKAEWNEEWNHIWSFAKKTKDQGSRKLKADAVSHTIRAECHGNNQFHYENDRRISMREAARFQSFPDNFEFKAKIRETERMIGNAVPPVLAWHIAGCVESALRGCRPISRAFAAE
jgi:DNA (cytosine-5)-methyltransferase 1